MNNDPVREQLLADARAMSPEFSETLHQRTVRSMRQANLRRRASVAVVPWWRAGLSVAAGLAMALTGWWVYSRPEVLDLVPRPTVLVMQEEPAESGGLLMSGGELQRMLTPPPPPIGHIEQHVRAAAQYMAGQFPSSLPGGKQQRM